MYGISEELTVILTTTWW